MKGYIKSQKYNLTGKSSFVIIFEIVKSNLKLFLFTATSQLCVTGLALLSTRTGFIVCERVVCQVRIPSTCHKGVEIPSAV
jgi:hypothetical protein